MYDISEAVQDHDDEDDNIEIEVDGSNELTPLNLVRPGVDPSSLISSDYGGLISGKNNTQSLAANAILTSNNNRDSSDFSMLRRRTQNTGQNDTIKSNNSNASIETIIQEYTTACQIYGCSNRINAGILTTFRFQLPSLRVSGSFFDSDMLALVEVLLNHVNGALSYIKRLDFSLAAMDGKQFGKKGIRSHGAYALSKVLQISMHIEEVFLTRNKIGPVSHLRYYCER